MPLHAWSSIVRVFAGAWISLQLLRVQAIDQLTAVSLQFSTGGSMYTSGSVSMSLSPAGIGGVSGGSFVLIGFLEYTNGSNDQLTFTTDIITQATFSYQGQAVSFVVQSPLSHSPDPPNNNLLSHNNNAPKSSAPVAVGGVNLILTVSLGYQRDGTVVPQNQHSVIPSGKTTILVIASLSEYQTTGGGYDPHFFTWKKERYDFHGECELVFLENPDFNKELGMHIHMRTKLRRNWSFVDRLAVKVGEDVLEVKGGTDETLYWINGQKGPALPETLGNGIPPFELGEGLGGFPITYKRANSKQRVFKILLNQGQVIEIRTYKDFVTVNIQNAVEEDFLNSRGLSGNFVTGHKLARDGVTVVEDPIDFGMEWQRRPDEPQLFSTTEDAPVQFPLQCVLPSSFEGVQRRRRLSESATKQAEAEKACEKLQDPEERKECIFDVILTNDIEMAQAY
jgi:hypothetical protein